MPTLSLVDLETLIVLGAALAAFVAVCAVWWALLDHDPTAQRIRALRDQHKVLSAEINSTRRNRRRRAAASGPMLTRLLRRLVSLKQTRARAVREKLERAGWRTHDAVVLYQGGRIALMICLVLAAAVVLYLLDPGLLAAKWKLPVLAFFAAIGFFIPDGIVSRATRKRQAQLQRSLPDGLDLLVICAEAGLTLQAALRRVADEMVRPAPVLADEFGLTAVELGLLPDRASALANLRRRTDLPAVHAIASTLSQSERYGTPLAQALRVLAGEFRTERLLKAETKAARLPATMMIPIVLFFLPCVFLVLIGPALIDAIAVFATM